MVSYPSSGFDEIAASYNGNTTDFGSVNQGSIPCAATNMETRRKAVNLICRFYEFDASKIASAIAAEQAEDNAALVDLLDGMIAELQSLVSGLNPPEPERRISKKAPEPREKKTLGRRPNPDRAQQKRNDYIAKRRSQLRHDGYHIEKNSMIAYWDDKTHRRKKTEASNIFGFIFKPFPLLKKKK